MTSHFLKTIPSICTEIIQPLIDPKTRDYNIQPIPPLDKRMIVWELKRPLLDSLPEIPGHLLQAYIMSVTLSEEEYDYTGETPQSDNLFKCSAEKLLDTKMYCIKALQSCLHDDAGSHGIDELGEISQSIIEWLENLGSTAVISTYLDLQNRIWIQNGYVVATNQVIHNATASSTNAILLGNSQQICGSLFYVIPYLCKNKVVLEGCLLALEKAQHHVQNSPSQATDTGTSKRFVQHMFTRVVHELSRSMQISDTHIALSLLNMVQNLPQTHSLTLVLTTV